MQPLRGSEIVLGSATQASPSGSLSLALRGKLGLLHRETPFGVFLIIDNYISATVVRGLGRDAPPTCLISHYPRHLIA